MTKNLTIDGKTSVIIKQSTYDMARFCWIRNRSEADIFASCVNSECTENADEVRRIPAGEYGMLDTESYEKLYLNGSGAVEIVTSAYAVCPFNRGGKGGGSYELPIATTEILGGVMPDGTTITVNENGVITAISAEKLNTSAGSSTKPVYFSGGKPVACSYTLGKSVPSNAVFTDTVYTLPKATTSVLGGVKVDGTTITVDSNGVISSAGGLTVDTLLDISGNRDTLNGRTITTPNNITDYKFLYCLGAMANNTISIYNAAIKILPVSAFEWNSWSTVTGYGISLLTINSICDVYYYSATQFKLNQTSGYSPSDANKTHRLVILGIK